MPHSGCQAWANFNQEWMQLRRSFRYDDYKKIATLNPPRGPLGKLGYAAGSAVVQVFSRIDEARPRTARAQRADANKLHINMPCLHTACLLTAIYMTHSYAPPSPCVFRPTTHPVCLSFLALCLSAVAGGAALLPAGTA